MTTRCARCRAGAARLVAPAGLLDRLLRLFFFLPFRCQVCTTRFHRFSIAAALQPQPEDKREYLRLLTSFQAVVAGVDGPAPARVVDLTVAGCGLETTTPMAKGAFIRLQLLPPEEQTAIRVETAIVRSQRPDAVGVQFLEFAATDARRLRDYVHSLLTQPNPAALA